MRVQPLAHSPGVDSTDTIFSPIAKIASTQNMDVYMQYLASIFTHKTDIICLEGRDITFPTWKT